MLCSGVNVHHAHDASTIKGPMPGAGLRAVKAEGVGCIKKTLYYYNELSVFIQMWNKGLL